LDCNTLDYEYFNADFKENSLVLLDSNVKHSLFTSAYNKRREECEEGLKIITEYFPEIKSYRDCSQAQLLTLKDKINPTTFTRIHFVVKEIARVNQACEALNNGNIEQLGQLLFDTHDGLSTEYEVSCEELDFLVTLAKKEEAVLGSRMMGGGFGGCAITIIKKGSENKIKEKFSKLYKEKWNIDLKIYDVKIGNGTTLYTI
jgi:galactokinase